MPCMILYDEIFRNRWLHVLTRTARWMPVPSVLDVDDEYIARLQDGRAGQGTAKVKDLRALAIRGGGGKEQVRLSQMINGEWLSWW